HPVPQDVMTPEGRPSWPTRLAVLLPSPSVTPFTFWYLAILLVTTVIQRLVGTTVSARLLSLASTDAHNLWNHPVRSLIASTLWIPRRRVAGPAPEPLAEPVAQ